MQYTPPHSPDHQQKNLGVGAQFQSHGHGTYPKGLGLDHHRQPEHYLKGPGPEIHTDTFAKRPISPPLSSGELSDSSTSHPHHAEHPVSLLSALMHSPRSTSGPITSGSGLLSPHSSVPSTAVSSPHLRPTSSAHSHGGLDVPAMSILRRDSVSSDGEALHLKDGHGLVQVQTQEVRPDVVKRASSLKFAVAPPLKRRSPSVHPHTPLGQAVSVAKFDTPSPRLQSDQEEEDEEEEEESPISVEIEEEDIDDRDNEAEDGVSEESDLGYQEDSESSDEDIDGSPRYRQGPKSKYPFARSTNYRRRRHVSEANGERERSPSPPPAPAVLPPPTRRGRGHIRVDESCISGKETEGGCSRHRSPPPSRSRSHSRSGDQKMERVGRLSDAGPRDGRAGSPMPSRSKILAASEDEEDQDQDQEVEGSPVDKKDVFGSWSGWKSDDASFYGSSSMVKGIRTVSAPPREPGSAIGDRDAGAVDEQSGVRSFFRRASEHIPAFRRPDPSMAYPQPVPAVHPMGRTLSPSNTSPCPPALDETPALASSIARVERDYSGGLAHRLEQSLSTSYRSEGEVRVQV